SDFYDRIEQMPSLARLATDEACYRLLPPDDAELGQMIRQPALEAGLRFEGDALKGIGLYEMIYQAAASGRGVLPLLSFLLDQLWQRRTDEGLLTLAAYRELGGIGGALARRAEEVFEKQPKPVQQEFIPVLRTLVTVEGGTATSRSAPLAQFP